MHLVVCLAAIWLSATASVAGKLPEVTILAEGYLAASDTARLGQTGSAPDRRRVATTVTLIKAENAVVITDPGMVAKEVDLVARLSAQGVAPEDVTHVFVSHHHPNHTMRVGMFPNATLVDVWGHYKDDMREVHAEDCEIAPGIRVLRTPGHTHNDASLVVEAAEGTYVLTHLWWNEDMHPHVNPFAENADMLQINRARMLAQADFIIPGHGKLFSAPK